MLFLHDSAHRSTIDINRILGVIAVPLGVNHISNGVFALHGGKSKS